MSNLPLKILGSLLSAVPNFKGKDFLTKKFIRPFVQNKDVELVINLSNDCRLICNLKDWIPWNIFVHGSYIAEANYQKFMLQKALNCSTIFDIGANIGYYTVQFSKATTGDIHAFEPMDYQYSVLIRNLLLNNISNVIPVKQIASDNNELIRIYQNLTGNTGTSSIYNETERYEDIQSISLDAYCIKLKITEVDLVKIDVEDHESSVLKGMQKLLSQKKVKNLFVEICNEHLNKAGTSTAEILKFLDSYGYNSYSIKTGQKETYKESNGDESLVYFTAS